MARLPFLISMSLAAGACGGDPDALPAPDASLGPSFELEAAGGGPALRLVVTPNEGSLEVRVVMGESVDLFGLSYHLR